MAAPYRLLLIDDDPHDRALAAAVLGGGSVASIAEVATATQLANALAEPDFDVVILEPEVEWLAGESPLPAILARQPEAAVVYLTRADRAAPAAEALRSGASEYLVKSSRSYVVLPEAVARAWEKARGASARRRAESWIPRLLDGAGIGVFRATPEHELLEASPGFLELLGVESLAQAKELELPELRSSSARLAELAARGQGGRGQLEEREVEIRRRDGTAIWVFLTEMLLIDGDGEVVIQGLVEDVGRYKQREAEQRAAIAELERANADLRDFAVMVSHELQGPLRMMERYSQLLQDEYRGRLSGDADEYIDFAVDGARTMQRLIDDLLQLARVSSEERNFQACDCHAALDRAIRISWREIEETGARVHTRPLPRVLGDMGQLVQLFTNLLSNALKFRSEGTPEIRVSAERDGEDWVFAVADNGLGVPSDQRERVFKVFKRLHPEYEGSGMGLAICQRIVQRHGGRIWIEPGSGIGTTVKFTLPRRGVASSDNADEENQTVASEAHD